MDYAKKVQRLFSWLDQRNGGPKLLFYHQDADGVCSAALMLKFFPEFKFYAREGPRVEDKFIDWAVIREPNLMIFVDIPIDQEWKQIQEIRKRLPQMRFVIIDHHIPEKDMTQKNVIHINPRLDDPRAYIPAAKMVYDILKEMGKDVRPYMWISAMGIIGDYAINECKACLKECSRAFPGLLDGEDPFQTKLGLGAELISSSITLKGLRGASYSLRLLFKAENFPDFASDSELKAWHKTVREEIEKLLKGFDANHMEHGKLMDYEIDSSLNIASVISTILSKQYPKNIVMVRKRSGTGWKISLRNQATPHNLGEMVKKAVEGLGLGGGHERAAGALLFEKDSVDNFKQKLVNQLEKS